MFATDFVTIRARVSNKKDLSIITCSDLLFKDQDMNLTSNTPPARELEW